MRVGLLSDTHGSLAPARAGVEALRAAGAEILIHCGDVGGTEILDLLAGDVPAYFVFGNNDWDRTELANYAADKGVNCLHAFGEVDLGGDGELAAVLHGDDAGARTRIIRGQRHRYLFQGHTHLRQDETIGLCRLINPGALHRAATKTVALLDTADGALTFIEIR
jgi:putative phosphoesterase